MFALGTTRILRVLRIRRYLILIDDEVQKSIGELALTVLVMLIFDASLIQYFESHINNYSFNVWIYAMMVTIATVGYGDITPQSIFGRIAVMSFISFAIIIVPKMSNELIATMSKYSFYARNKYTMKKNRYYHNIYLI